MFLQLKWKQNITRIKNSFQMIDILGERAYNISTRIGGDYMLDVNMIEAKYPVITCFLSQSVGIMQK